MGIWSTEFRTSHIQVGTSGEGRHRNWWARAHASVLLLQQCLFFKQVLYEPTKINLPRILCHPIHCVDVAAIRVYWHIWNSMLYFHRVRESAPYRYHDFRLMVLFEVFSLVILSSLTRTTDCLSSLPNMIIIVVREIRVYYNYLARKKSFAAANALHV